MDNDRRKKMIEYLHMQKDPKVSKAARRIFNVIIDEVDLLRKKYHIPEVSTLLIINLIRAIMVTNKDMYYRDVDDDEFIENFLDSIRNMMRAELAGLRREKQ